MEKIGDLRKVRENRERIIEWKVRDFFALPCAIGTHYESPDFHFCDNLWNLRLYPNGYAGSGGYISIYLARLSSGSPITLDFSFALKSTVKNSDFVQQISERNFLNETSYGFPNFILRSTLMSRKGDLAFEDDITIICTLKNKVSVVLPVNEFPNDKCVQTESHLITNVSMESLSEDFSELLSSAPTYDAEVKCGEQSVKVHKMILSVRSEVLKAMFESDMLEGRTGIIEIKDMDAHYLQDFIKYLYTGSLSDMTFDKATCLYETGDKYAMKCLMFRCSEYLQNNLSPKIVCQCLALADSHVDKELKDIATKYILDEKIYLEDELWLPFCDSFPKLSNEVYRLAFKATQNNNV